jgi:lysozyme
MTPSELNRLRAMLEQDEGLRLKPYRCTAGKLSLGIGRNIEDVGISKTTAYQMLEEDIERSVRTCRSIFGIELWDKWGPERRMGWINFAFQLGPAGMLGFRNTLRAAMAEDWKKVEENFKLSRWIKQTPQRAERVIAAICKEQWAYGA